MIIYDIEQMTSLWDRLSSSTNLNRDVIDMYTSNSRNIKLSCLEYRDLVEDLLDDRLTPDGLLKFKHLARDMTFCYFIIPVIMYAPAWYVVQWSTGFVRRGMGSARVTLAGMSLVYPMFLYYGANLPLPRKLHSDILCDAGLDGSYVREVLRTKKPALWQRVSKQLYDNRFSFPEMLEYNGYEFTSNFINQRVRLD